MRWAAVERLKVVGRTSTRSAHDHRPGPRLAMGALARESGLEPMVVGPSTIHGPEAHGCSRFWASLG